MSTPASVRCPLCGAHLDALSLLGTCEGVVDIALGVLGGRCPHCQGYLEIRPVAGQLDVGYLDKASGFEVVRRLPHGDLTVMRCVGSDELTVQIDGRPLRFTALD